MTTETELQASKKSERLTRQRGARPLAERYGAVRRFTELLCEPLGVEDFVVQSMPDVSPTKWHLAHTSWFFEALVLSLFKEGYQPFNGEYSYLFNSYYKTLGPQLARPCRGVLSRPTVEQVFGYRAYVDEQMLDLLSRGPLMEEAARVVTVGLHHEQQHQELLLTDIKHVFASNPLRPVYRAHEPRSNVESPPMGWYAVPPGLHWIGHEGPQFAYDNETPRHRVFVEAVEIATRLVTNGEFLAFVEDGGYDRPELWLSDGWNARRANDWTAPLYWEKRDGRWWTMTLGGMDKLDPAQPVCHVSYYEADAYARWKGATLPTEAAWEVAAETVPLEGNFVESGRYHPTAPSGSDGEGGLSQMLGDVWEWTSSPYAPYPGYQPWAGPLGEYNAKFMANQMVLRGGSCATSRTHIRRTYRNFFPPDARWQFSGFRLAKGVRS